MVGRSDGCWLRHQPISCSHSVTETQGDEEEPPQEMTDYSNKKQTREQQSCFCQAAFWFDNGFESLFNQYK